MKHASLLALAALFAAVPALAVPDINDVRLVDNEYDALLGGTLEVELAAAGAELVYCDWTQGDTTVRIYLEGSGINWSCALPPCRAGGVSVAVTAEDAEGRKSSFIDQPFMVTENTTDPAGLNSYRYPDLTEWNTLTGGTDPDWIPKNFDRVAGISQMVRLRGTSNPSEPPMTAKAIFQSGAFYTRKISDGVGSIWFKAKTAGRKYPGGQLKILKFVTKGKSSRRVCTYMELATLSVPAASGLYEWHQFHVILQDEADVHNDEICDDQKAQYVIYNDSPATPIDICDIVLTPLIPDVVVYKDEADYAPGYPSLQDPIEFHIAVSNRWALAPAANFTPVLMWRQQREDDWTPTPMTNVLGRTNTGDGVYACALDENTLRADGTRGINAGPFEYYYKVSFTGYTPTFPARKNVGPLLYNVVNDRFGWGQYPYLIHVDDWALLADENGNVNEGRSPAYKPDFYDAFGGIQFAQSLDVAPESSAADAPWDLTGRFKVDDLEFEDREDAAGFPSADVVYPYLSRTGEAAVPGTIRMAAKLSYLGFLAEDGVRRFRSMYTHMTAVPRPWDGEHPGFDIDAGAVPGLEDSYKMQLVGDYTWQAIIHQTNAIDGVFAVTGALHSAAGSTVFENGSTNGEAASPYFWLEPNQEPTSINPPSSGYVDRFRSESVEREREVTYYEEVLVTNVTETTTPALVRTVRPAGSDREIPFEWALPIEGADGTTSTNWTPIAPSWTRARKPVRVDNVLLEGVSGDGVNYFFTQYATVTISYDDDDNEIVTTNAWSSGPWAPVVETREVEGEPTTVTNWFPAAIPDTWLKVNWTDESGVADTFPTYRLTGLDTNGWDFSAVSWTTNEWNDLATLITDLELAAEDDGTAGWAQVNVHSSALASSTVALHEDATYVDDVRLGVDRIERTRTETYYTYRPVPAPYEPEQLGTRVQIDYDGFLMYRFCTTNGDFQVRRAAWQDFNAWQADDKLYSRSFGIYDMKEFLSNLEGRDVTVFAKSFDSSLIDEVKAMEDYSPAAGEYMYGFIGKNARAIKDRVLSENAVPADKARNTEVVLRGYPGLEGSLETTSENKGAGRGTLTMRVRSHTDDARSVVYRRSSVTGADPLAWENYRVMARIMNPVAGDVSDAEHSLSLIGYWQDPFNYWEARIIQKSELTGDARGRTRNWFEVHLYAWIDGEPHEQLGYIQNNGYGGNNYAATDKRRPTWPGWNNDNNNGSRNDQGYWNNGNSSEYGLFTLNRTDTGPWCFVLDLKTEGSMVTPMVWAFRSKDIENGKCAAATLENVLANQLSGNYFLYKFGGIALAGATTAGAPGFNMRDCGLKIAPYVLNVNEPVKFTGSATQTRLVVTSDPADNWYRSDDAAFDSRHKVNVWTVESHNNLANPTILTRPAPKVFYGVRTYRTGKEEFPEGMFVAPVPFHQFGDERDWDDDWDSYNNHASDHDKWVQQYQWKDVPVPMDLWDQTFISIQALASSGGVRSGGNLAIDTIECNDFRGVTVWDKDYADTNLAATASFRATYSAIAQDGRTGRRYELNRARANPGRSQSITTPQLVHGVGDILFNYEVVDYPVKVRVQVGDWTGSEWSDLPGGTSVLPAGSSGSLYVPCLSNDSGRMRIVAETPEGAPAGALGTLYVDNIRATDYPNKGDTSWEVYNALVSTFPKDVAQEAIPPLGELDLRRLKFDGWAGAAASYRSAVLNDGSQKQTAADHDFNEHVPFVQTPSIETGVGEVSFWYRASPDNTGPAKLLLQVAKVGTTPDWEWTTMTADNLGWDDQTYDSPEEDPEFVLQRETLRGLDEITNDEWRYFSVEFYEEDFRLLRIVGATNDDNRVMLDNVLITEPVRPSVDVGAIEFTPDIPLCTGGTDAKVTLVNPRKNPEDIHVYLDWYVQKTPIVELASSNEWVVVITNAHDNVYVIPGTGIEAHYTTYTYETNSRPIVEITRVPENLRWGYLNWSNRWETAADCAGGSIPLTNDQATAPYVFYTTRPIPTDSFPADTVFQYCVRVEYRGRFAKPVYSELQGRVKNGFWFENPKWYEPIDLNKTFDTRERPVAHFWNFSCTTNVVFINEILPVYGSLPALKQQFIELMGPQGASVEKWRIEHLGFDDTGELNANYIVHTNIVTSGDAKGAAFQASRVANTNKGWGFWVLGCHGIDENGEKLSNQKLFPDSWVDVDGVNDNGIHDVPWFMGVPGALRLRRSMGAYADAVVWGPEWRVTDIVRAGYKYLRDTYYDFYSLAWEGFISQTWEGDITKELSWNLAWSPTIGSYNLQQEEVLPFLGGGDEDEEEAPGIDQPEIRAFDFANEGLLRIKVAVRVDAESAGKGLALKPEHYRWYFERTSELENLGVEGLTDLVPFPTETSPVYDADGNASEGPSAGADGEWSEFLVEVPVYTGAGAADAMFYRVVARPRQP